MDASLAVPVHSPALRPRGRKDVPSVAARNVVKPFGEVLRDLLAGRDEFLTHTRNINWSVVADALDGVHYETLRKAVAGDRMPTPHLLEQVAALAGVNADVFAEYRLYLAQREFDVREVGWDRAMSNLREFTEAHAAPSRKKR